LASATTSIQVLHCLGFEFSKDPQSPNLSTETKFDVLDNAPTAIPDFLLDAVDVMAFNLHELWAVQKVAAGYVWGETRNDTDKVHPDLVPYFALARAEQDYDRRASMYCIKCLQTAGYTIKPSPSQKQWRHLGEKMHHLTEELRDWFTTPTTPMTPSRRATDSPVAKVMLQGTVTIIEPPTSQRKIPALWRWIFLSHDSTVTGENHDCYDAGIFHPDCQFWFCWEVALIMLVLYISFFTTYKVAFNIPRETWEDYVDIFLECFFVIDIPMNLYIAKRSQNGELVLDSHELKRMYAQSWLIPDCVSGLPVQTISLMANGASAAGDLAGFKVIRAFKIIHLVSVHARDVMHWFAVLTAEL
jgi:hypothetical protein